MNLPVSFSVQAGETYDAIIAQLKGKWGIMFVRDSKKK